MFILYVSERCVPQIETVSSNDSELDRVLNVQALTYSFVKKKKKEKKEEVLSLN